MPRNTLRASLLTSMICGVTAFAAEDAPTSPKSNADWTVDDVLSFERASDFRVSPDCRWALWVKNVPDKDKNEWVSHLFLSSLTGDKEVQLTRGGGGCSSPRWSPDGQLIAFLSSRPHPKGKPDDKEKTGLWLINPFGGEPWPLTDGERAVLALNWAGTNSIIYSAQEERSLHEQALKEKKETSQVAEDELHEPPVRLFNVDLKSKQVARLTGNQDRIRDFWVSPDGRRVITVHERSLRNFYDQSLKPVVFLTELSTGERQPLFTDPKFNIWRARWERDSRGFYAVSGSSSNPRYSFPATVELYHYTVAGGAVERVDLGWDKGLAGAGLEVTDQGFITLLADGARPKPARYARAGDRWQREWLSGLHVTNLFGFEIGSDDRTFVYEYSTPAHPDQWFRSDLNGSVIESPLKLTSLNPQLAKKTMAQTELVHWAGALGETVEGLLHYPHDYQSGKKYPLVVDIHGGPAAVYLDTWQSYPIMNNEFLNARGAFVFRPNYHGSVGYGSKWLESILGRLNALEVQDIETGVDYLIGRGLADPNKLGVMGWSQGGVLTAAVTVRTNRYKAAIAGDGVIDWIDYWAKSDIGAAFCGSYMGKTPLEDPMLYVRTSSFYRMQEVTTPTLILFGSDDKRVPVEQGWMHYRALQQTGKADVRFVLFPGDGHGPSKLVHLRRTLEEEAAWFDKYLFQKINPDKQDLKPDSPLAVALKLKAVKADGVRYGLLKNGTLIPETVRHADLELGRFEVTRAQFAEFDKGPAVEPAHENFPASGITFDQAKAYCAWLSKLTADTYRLPDQAEAQSLYDKPAGSENTLDYWAGGAVNPDDASKLQTAIRELGGRSPLLKEAGSFKASDPDQTVFDLGGNVAEWAVATDGMGQPMGGSADTPADQKIRKRAPASEYIGFRVVKGNPGRTAPDRN